ncbi:DNA polymerase III subunit delta' [Enterobacter sp. CC120223-11]|uniref:DNA polymerase III subunit delta' n=1 Tax=Enterobacter sp. CC120223-11 TaxID=1378073 RepID=UPI000BDA69E7|nr:DNA polymerase III subunit delta' [Enterobacter sp. CC120223-11]SNY60007.1 DNA polymerase-3 subunit delta' [Enterobacter sp. CC120223-11]
MKWYPWLRPPFEQLVSSYQSGRGHHALLVQALPGMGAEALVYALVRFQMCHSPEGQKSCGKCHSCQLMQAGTHPDYYQLAPEKGKSTLGIDAVRDITEKLYERARLGGAKVVWLNDAALLTEAAANALLKTLEEPPENTWFFLQCEEPARLLATLRSRCRHFHLAPPAENYGLAWLGREVTMSQEHLLTALRLTAGAPAAALDLLAESHSAPRQQLCAALDGALQSGDWLSLLPVLNHDSVADRLYWLASLLLDAQKMQQGITLLTNVDAWALVQRVANQLSSARLQAMVRDASECRERLQSVTGLNRELMLNDCLLRWEHWLRSADPLPTPSL